MKYNYTGTQCIIQSSQSTSAPGSVPVFITPMEYKISRSGKADTTLRVMHTNATETYTIALQGTITAVVCDPNNWIINKTIGPARDATLGTSTPTVDYTSISEEEDFTEIRIGPNPAKHTIQVVCPTYVVGRVQLYTLQGKLLAEKALSKETVIDISGLTNGVYVVKILNAQSEEKIVHKVIKE